MKRWMVLLIMLLVGCGQLDVQAAMVTAPEATQTQVKAETEALVLQTATPPPASEGSGETAASTEATTIEPIETRVSADSWITYTGTYVTFQVPASWTPSLNTPGYGSVLEDWSLGIPGMERSDTTLAFFDTPFSDMLPDNAVSATAITIGGKPGTKWVRVSSEGSPYVAYAYYTTGYNNEGSFGVHVTIWNTTGDAELEGLLDRLVASITFN